MLVAATTTRHRVAQQMLSNDAASVSSDAASNESKPGTPSTTKRKQVASIRISLAIALAALSASLATLITAIGASYVITKRYESYNDSVLDHTRDAVQSSHRGRGFDFPSTYEEQSNNNKENRNESVSAMNLSHRQHNNRIGDAQQPMVTWLMSFPNSGTSFTIHLTREASNTTTATNYALEGDIRDKPSVPAIAGSENGPYLELIPNRFINIPKYILTKTHCGGFCASCRPLNYIETPRSFQVSCQTGRQALLEDNMLKLKRVTYDAEIVKRAIHIIRHPLDNIVARFHLEASRNKRSNNTKWLAGYPYNKTGFHRWCDSIDREHSLVKMRWVDDALARSLGDVPCHAEFFRYVQWHNLAFSVSRDMGIPTLIIHYNDYRDDFDGTLTRLLNFLELPRVGRGVSFSSGKEYKNYYSLGQRVAVEKFVKELATVETWKEMQRYSFS